MREIKMTHKFRKDLEREYRGRYREIIDKIIDDVTFELADNRNLALKYRDHDLKGKWRGFRECHLKPDLLLIYQKQNENILLLVRMGSHSELGLA